MTKEAREHNEFVKVDFAHANPKCQYFKDGNLIKKWNVKKKDAEEMVFGVIDAQNMGKFEANKIKSMIHLVSKTFDPKTIKIVKKEPNELNS